MTHTPQHDHLDAAPLGDPETPGAGTEPVVGTGSVITVPTESGPTPGGPSDGDPTDLLEDPVRALDEVVDEHLDVEADRHELPQTFADFGVQEPIVRALAEVGITHPFPIQALTLPVALSGHDIIGQAKTGTGKTLGFGIPVIQRTVGPGEPGWADLARPGRPQALVVVPTRELAVQVAGDFTTASRHRSVRILQVYGGRAYEPQVEALRTGVEIVVGTPGRMIDLMRQGALELGNASSVVLDEADEMLDLGFLPDVETLMSATAASRHTMLFSATMPGAVVALARRYMSRPTHIRAHDPHDEGITLKSIKQVVYRAHSLDKIEILARLLQADGRGLTIVFVRTKRTAARVAEDLAERGFAAAAIHGDLGQGAREQALRAFRNGKVDVLVATDVAARGIDVENVTHVVNYQCPEDEKTYLHRTGRTGRAGNTGTAVTLVDWDDMPRWSLIDKALGLGQPEPPETYSTSPHVYSDLNIPAGTKGVLPRRDRTRAGLAAEELEDLGETGKARRPTGARAGGRAGAGDREGAGGRDGGRDAGRGRRRGGGDEPRSRQRDAAGSDEPRSRQRDAAGSEPAPDAAAGGTTGEDRPRRSRNRRRTRRGAATTPTE